MKLIDITPSEFVCANCSACPAVFDTGADTYVIIGKKLSTAAEETIKGRVGSDEYVIEVPKGMIDGLK